ncbi:major capsid protein [Novosphingobium resinovorum]|uniref:Major capsid protein n=1 Tax=Novosphingobium resinovorum TaxID=158500 RepID=A0A1D8A3C7_9SPHN|nr:major capsid protein [Novosphingobium resinovorum]AOR76576.1 hypothetical protein BES08_07300 [Novosphingobium resinovorum]
MTIYSPAPNAPYQPWSTHKLLGVFRDMRPETWYFGQFFTGGQMRSTDEWIDFEKLPIRSRSLAPFVRPMGRGKGALKDRVQGFRFKPANIVAEDAVDPFRPLSFAPGIDVSALHMNLNNISPMQRKELIKAQMVQEFQQQVMRTWEWMKARAIIDGKVTCNYLDGTSVEVDFQRDTDHTEVLTSGNYWGDSGVSLLDHVQRINDTMVNAEFGGALQRITMGGSVASIVRQDNEILDHMDLNVKGGVHVIDRSIASADKVYKFGELFIGGASGQTVELWVNNEEYTDAAGNRARYLGDNEIVATGSPTSINGWECFGMIVDEDAQYQALPLFPKDFKTGERTKVENISVESAPLFVPINPNATYKATVKAPA